MSVQSVHQPSSTFIWWLCGHYHAAATVLALRIKAGWERIPAAGRAKVYQTTILRVYTEFSLNLIKPDLDVRRGCHSITGPTHWERQPFTPMGLIGDSKLPITVNGCLSLCCLCVKRVRPLIQRRKLNGCWMVVKVHGSLRVYKS